MKKFMVLITFFLCSSVLAQTNVSIITYDPFFTPFTDFYASHKLSVVSGGRGYAGLADEGGPEFSLMNPASLNNKGLIFSAGYNYKTDMEWYPGAKFTAYQPPLLAGLGFSMFDKLNIGALYYDKSNFKFVVDLSDYYLEDSTTIREDDSDLSSLILIDEIYQRTISIPISFCFNKYFKVGVDFDYSFFFHKFYVEKTPDSYEKASFELLTTTLGLNIKPTDDIAFGFTFSPEYKKQFTTERVFAFILPDTSWPDDLYNDTILEPKENKFPLSAGLGIKYLLSEKIKLFADYHFVNASIYPYYFDRHDINIGVEYLHKKTTLRAGAFTLMDFRKPDMWLQESAGTEHQYFLTGGASYPFGPVEINLSLMDNHLLSPGNLKQTQISCGLNYRIF